MVGVLTACGFSNSSLTSDTRRIIKSDPFKHFGTSYWVLSSNNGGWWARTVIAAAATAKDGQQQKMSNNNNIGKNKHKIKAMTSQWQAKAVKQQQTQWVRFWLIGKPQAWSLKKKTRFAFAFAFGASQTLILCVCLDIKMWRPAAPVVSLCVNYLVQYTRGL